MKILVDISHPAHVHFFKHAIAVWRQRGREVAVASRDKDITLQLLDALEIPHQPMSRLGRGPWGLVLELIEHDRQLYRLARRFGPDVLCQIGGIFVAHVGALLGRPTVIFYDTEMNRVLNRLTYPLATAVATPRCYRGHVGPNHIRYDGYHELAYLHPNRFTPRRELIAGLGLDPAQPYFIVRFVGWGAAHDVGEKGLATQTKRELVRLLATRGRVLISSEAPLPGEFEPFRFALPPQLMHQALAHAALVVGESATMASEAAVLGVPAVFLSTSWRGYTDEQERRYGLVRNFGDHQQAEVLEAVRGLLERVADRDVWQARRARLLREKIDVTPFIVKLVEAAATSPRRGRWPLGTGACVA